jgi:hypothetical protein
MAADPDLSSSPLSKVPRSSTALARLGRGYAGDLDDIPITAHDADIAVARLKQEATLVQPPVGDLRVRPSW